MKVFIKDVADLETYSITELLEKSTNIRNLLHAYKYVHVHKHTYMPHSPYSMIVQTYIQFIASPQAHTSYMCYYHAHTHVHGSQCTSHYQFSIASTNNNYADSNVV